MPGKGEGGSEAMPRHSKAQNARTRPHRPVGDLQALRRKMWQAVIEAEAILVKPRASISTKIRAIHALTQAGVAYHRLLTATELETRVAALEAAVQARRNGHHVPF
jgi:hypothetical protein